MDAVTADSADAKELSLWARWGSPCGMPFYAEKFLKKNPQFEYLREFLRDRPSLPWTRLKADMLETDLELSLVRKSKASPRRRTALRLAD